MPEFNPIAIVGMGGIFPGALDLRQFWENILARRSAARRAPAGRWTFAPEVATDGVPVADGLLSDRACFVDDFQFDPTPWDLDSDWLAGLDPMFHFLLRAGCDAWQDASLGKITRQRAGVIIGNIVLPSEHSGKLAEQLLSSEFERQLFPDEQRGVMETDWINRYVAGLPAGLLARTLNFGGGSFTLDAACASSLYAIKLAADKLASGETDVMLAGGLSRPDSLYTQMGFSQLQALSPSGCCAPFDQHADGLVVGEGSAMFVLRRLADAVREGNSIHAVIRGVGLSNDVGGNLMLPDSEGQLRAMRSAYRQAGWQPNDVDLIECHGTGTPTGDAVEFESLRQLWSREESRNGQCVIGSVKSNVGHLLTAAGGAGLAKVLCAMREEVLPPTAHFSQPSDRIDLDNSSFQVLKDPTEWNARSADVPRRAAISAFGFGGINAHMLLEQWPATKACSVVTGFDSKDSREWSQNATNPDDQAIAIVGMDAHFGPFDSLNSFAHRVLGGGADAPKPTEPKGWFGSDAADRFRGYFIDKIDIPVGRFRIPPNELREMLPQQLLMLQVAAGALEDAGGKVPGAGHASVDDAFLKAGVFIGIGLDLNTTNFHFRWSLDDKVDHWAKKCAKDLSAEQRGEWLAALRDAASPALSANRTMGALGGIVASRIARTFRVGGPSFTVSNEESSGMRALEMAVRWLRAGEIDQAFVGAVDLAGDIRAVLGHNDRRSFVDTNPLGEGAACLVLRRLSDAKREGDRIYAVVRGIGNATGGKPDSIVPPAETYQSAASIALRDADCRADSIGHFEIHGGGHDPEDTMEMQAIAHLFKDRSGNLPCAIGGVTNEIGHTGAASGLASLVKASLCLYHRQLPSGKQAKRLRDHLAAQSEGIFVPSALQHWLHNRAGDKRRAAVSSFSIDGNCLCAILEEPPDQKQKLPTDVRLKLPEACLRELPSGIVAIYSSDTNGLLAEIDTLSTLVRESHGSVSQVASRWWKSGRSKRPGGVTAVVRASDFAELEVAIGAVRQAIVNGKTIAGERGAFYCTRPLCTTSLTESGEVALVYPGAGNQYLGMGREIGVQWPALFDRLEKENERLADQFGGGRFWTQTSLAAIQHKDVVFGQVWLGTLVTDLLSKLEVVPQAMIGYSLGETTAFFSSRSWTDRDEMLRRMDASPLFRDELSGPCHAARRAWNLSPEVAVDWRLGVVNVRSSLVRAALTGRTRVYLLIVNTPGECVIGGNRQEVERLVADLKCAFRPIEGVTTVHCEVAKSVEKAYRELHLLQTNPPENLRFYSGAWEKSYPVTRESAADSIAAQAVGPFDYTKVIEAAYHDGVRVFVEVGPGNSCCRMIGQILGDRPFVAVPMCGVGRSEVETTLDAMATLIAHGAGVNLDFLYPSEPDVECETSPKNVLTIPVGGQPFRVPLPPEVEHEIDLNRSSIKKGLPEKIMPETTIASVSPKALAESVAPQRLVYENNSDAPAGIFSSASGLSASPLVAKMMAIQSAEVAAEKSYLGLVDSLRESITQTISNQMSLVRGAGPTVIEKAETTAVPESVPKSLDRVACLEFAVGSVRQVLGDAFAELDTYSTRVRLPDEPLMLVDRICQIDAEPLSMSGGRIVTEHDVLPGAWYLDSGRIPTCLAVEAGQADLFLAGYLGIDFETRGEAVYRLLDADVTFFDSLPEAGSTIRYEIEIDEFFRQDETYLFRFRFEATVNGKRLLSMEKGCAGFFTPQQLDDGRGIVRTTMDTKPVAGNLPDDWQTLVSMAVESYTDEQVDALRNGDLESCFGPQFANLGLQRATGIPDGRMTLVHRIVKLDPEGGRFGLGQIVGQADIHPLDWFLTCHFVDDRVMPGTLMYECCLHTLRIFLLRMGWVGEAADVCYEPISQVTSRLKCRGQVTEQTERVEYELTIKELGYTEDGTAYVMADALMYADGKPVVQMNNMSLRLSGLTRSGVKTLWANRNSTRAASEDCLSTPAPILKRKPLFDTDRILAFAIGNPSDAFGDRYRVFDEQRVIARLPGPPFQFLDRIVSIESCQPWQLKAGGVIEGEYDVPPDAWYFSENRQPEMPFAVLLEIALQPCGWLAAYLGSALASDVDVSFRNLGGSAVQSLAVLRDSRTLTTKIKITNISRSGGMIIQNYDFCVRSSKGIVYQGDTYFGFFAKEALANQVGIRNAPLYQPNDEDLASARQFSYPIEAPFPDQMMRMIERVDLFAPGGGPHGLGFIRGTSRVRREAWFFKAHFHQDPVWPGSLGLESFVQLLKVVAQERWGDRFGPDAEFRSPMLDHEHKWSYRGQIVPWDEKVTVEAVITGVDDDLGLIEAEGFLSTDGRTIYQMERFTLTMRPKP